MEQHSHVFKVTYVKMYVFCFVFLFLFFDPALMMISFQILQDPLEMIREAIGKVMPGQLARSHEDIFILSNCDTEGILNVEPFF